MPALPFIRTLLALSLATCAFVADAAATLKPYRDEAEFTASVQRWRAEAQRRQAVARRADGALALSAAPAAAPAPPML